MENNKLLNLDERYILDVETGICHDLDNFDTKCELHKIKYEDLFSSDYLYDEIKRHPSYKKKCEYCMHPNI